MDIADLRIFTEPQQGASYATLLAVDFWLMRRYARIDPPGLAGEGEELPVPAVSY